ncbi:MAG: ASCH domain-containing protein [Alphaproteobacteria bacterium]|nr:ASCH domain-containing protein [Alphaproteobacteria bacterium]
MHKMNVKTKYYNLLKSEKKVVELRLFDEKRKQIKIGDEILFSDSSNTNDSFIARVINLHRAESFDKLCQIITPAQAGFTSKEELITVLEEFYTPASQQKYGVLGIEIKKI